MLLFRILLNPAAGEGASTPPGDGVATTRTGTDALRAKAEAGPDRGATSDRPARISSGRRDHGEVMEDTEAGGMDARGDFERVLKERETILMREIAARDQRVAELERACRSAMRDRELATALAGKPLVPGAVAQLIKLWRDDFDVYEEGGEYRVTAREGRAVGQAVAERLSSPEYAHFCLPSSRGGAGARDANRPATAVAGNAPRNLGEAVLVDWRKGAAARSSDLAKPIGLGRRR
jgi:hypothetical protein